MSIRVSDPFNAAADSALPTLAAALNPEIARHEFKRRLPRLSGTGRLRLREIRVVRHKPGKRCVVEYDVEVQRPEAREETVTLIGKVRARRSGNEGLRQLETIWNAGFAADSADGICVPEPIGVISEFNMWFQRKVPGVTATKLLTGPVGVALARRIAEAAHKLHRANLPTDREHRMADELRILRECMAKVATLKPEWSARLDRLMRAAENLGASFAPARRCGIHRDFYPAQVLVERGLQPASTCEGVSRQLLRGGEDGGSGSGVNAALLGRLWLIDFDLVCAGDPGLDVGNFLGHVIEQAFRERGDADACQPVACSMLERFVELTGGSARASVEAYTTLTLARHVYLSTQFSERTHTTERLLELCEARLA